MTRFVVNITNHPIERWGEEQKGAAGLGAGIEGVDIPFPHVDPAEVANNISGLAHELALKVVALGTPYQLRQSNEGDFVDAVLVQGESTLQTALVSILLSLRYQVVAATSWREVVEEEGRKTSIFRFVAFRPYALPSTTWDEIEGQRRADANFARNAAGVWE